MDFDPTLLLAKAKSDNEISESPLQKESLGQSPMRKGEDQIIWFLS